jgi:hypothetical protein
VASGEGGMMVSRPNSVQLFAVMAEASRRCEIPFSSILIENPIFEMKGEGWAVKFLRD